MSTTACVCGMESAVMFRHVGVWGWQAAYVGIEHVFVSRDDPATRSCVCRLHKGVFDGNAENSPRHNAGAVPYTAGRGGDNPCQTLHEYCSIAAAYCNS